jgi:hypothetical protein
MKIPKTRVQERLSKKSKWQIPAILASLRINNLQAVEKHKMASFRVFRQSRKKSVNDQNPSAYLVSPKLHVQKGLPFGFDVGLAVGQVLDPNITYAGGEVRYALLKGGAVLPAVAVRGSYSQTFGVDQLDLKTYGLDLSVSKGFGAGVKIIPYGGLGQYWFSSKPKNLTPGLNLNEENFSKTQVFAGARLQMALFTVTGQVDYIEVPSFSLRVGITW